MSDTKTPVIGGTTDPNDPFAGIDWELLQRVLIGESLIAYIKLVAPWFTIEEVHCVLAAHLEAVARGDLDRIMFFMLPRGGKSMTASVFFPSWWAGKLPSDKIMQVGHKVELSRGFSLDVRALMETPEYQWAFPGVRLAKDAKAAGRWRVEDWTKVADELEKGQRSRTIRQQQGQYNAAGVTSGIAGTGFNLGIVDDPMSEQDKDSKIVKDRLWNWWGPGFYTRRQPERNAIVLMMTRWAKDDLPGRLLELQHQRHHGADVWTVVNIPAILNADSAKRVYTIAKEYGQMEDVKPLQAGDSCMPRRWSKKELQRSRATLTERDWQALYMGNPLEEEGHVLKKKYWRLWPKDKMPECDFILQTYDTAMDEDTRNDFSARTTWGIFPYKEQEDTRPTMNMILLDRWKKRVEAPDLAKYVMAGAWGTKEAREAYLQLHPRADWPDDLPGQDALGNMKPEAKGFNPDRILVEYKMSGIWLVKELRRIRVPKSLPVWPYKLPRGTAGELGKYARALRGSLVLEQGAVWYPKRNWAVEVIDGCAKCRFDGSDESDDLEDTVVHALNYVRDTYRVELKTDIDEDMEAQVAARKKVKRRYYGART